MSPHWPPRDIALLTLSTQPASYNHPYCVYSVLNVKALVGAFNKEKALAGAFSLIVKHKFHEGSFPALFLIHVCVQLLVVLTELGGRTCASEAKAAKEMEIKKD